MVAQLIRDAVPIDLTWNLDDIYPSPEAWQADVERLDEQLAEVAATVNAIGAEAGSLLAFLRKRDTLAATFEKILGYAQLRRASDALSPENGEMAGRAGILTGRVVSALVPFETRLLELPEGTVEQWLEEEPGLEPYRLQLEAVLQRRPYMLSPETERVLAALTEVHEAPGVIHGQVTATAVYPPIQDASGQVIGVSPAAYMFGLAQSPDREMRRKGYESVSAGSDTHKVALAGTLAATIARNAIIARERGYASTAEMFLQPQGVPVDVYNTVVDAMHDELAPHVRRLLDVRQRVLGLARLRMYDLAAPLDPDFDPRTSYEEGVAAVRASLAPLGDEYAEVLDRAFGNRWIDRGTNAGRADTPFCFPMYTVHPYLLTVWEDRMASAFVLTHELGHACHGDLANRAQPISNGTTILSLDRITLFVEVPSRIHELFLAQHLIDTADDERVRRWAIMHLLDSLLGSLRTTMLGSHIERRLIGLAEAGEPITLPTIMQAQGDVLESFFGPALEVDDAARLYWVPWPHMYSGLYSFVYPAGMAAAYGILDSIRRNGEPAARCYLDALRSGASRRPLDLMRLAGVDLGRREPIRRFAEFFGAMVTELEETMHL